MPSLHAILIFLIPLPFTITHFISTAAEPKRLVIKLLHRDSILRNPNDTLEVRSQRALNASIARFIYLSQKLSVQTQNTGAHAHLQHGTALVPIFYVNFSIGQPPVPQLATLDTGSNLVWVKCQPCEQCRATTFDPSKSLTYANLPCNSSYCSNDCRKYSDECLYEIHYADGTDSHGAMGVDQFSFETSDEGKILVNDLPFGCSHTHKIAKFEDEHYTGVFGLGPRTSPLSTVIENFGSKFSYCIGSLSNYEYSHNMLILGEGTIFEGDSTPIDIIDGTYYVTLEGISIGEKMLDIDPNLFKRKNNWSFNGVVFDSGTTFTWLVPGAYQTIRKEIEDLSEGLLQRYLLLRPAWHLCFSGKISPDLHGFPAMAFHFAGGTDLVLDVDSLFIQHSSSVFCLAVGPTDIKGEGYKDLSIIGVIAQQNYNVAFDLVNKQMYFQRIDCQLLLDD